MPDASMLLVTGATGFIGRIVCEEARRRGVAYVTAVRRPSSATDESMRVVGDIGRDTEWGQALAGVDAVVHVAGLAHAPVGDAAAEAAVRETNVLGAERLAEAAAERGVRRFVLLSTVKVNGERTTGEPFREDDTPAPKGIYAVSKWEAEQRVRAVAARSGMACTIVRTPLVYGPGVRANFLGLLRIVDRGWPLPFGAVRNARSLVFVRNLADALLHCAARTDGVDETYLVKDGPDTSTPELVRRIAAALGRTPRLVPVPPALLRGAARLLGRGDVADRLLGSLMVSDALLRERTGWRPPHTMDDGLRETARWYLSTRDGGAAR